MSDLDNFFQRVVAERWLNLDVYRFNLVARSSIFLHIALRPFDWRVLPIKLVHAGRLSDPVSRRDVYEQEQPGLW